MEGLSTFALGVGAALVASAAGPPLGRRLRPLVRGAIKQAIIVGQGARVRAAGLREDFEDLVEEARDDASRSRGTEPAGPRIVQP
jgi:hypothetical protein